MRQVTCSPLTVIKQVALDLSVMFPYTCHEDNTTSLAVMLQGLKKWYAEITVHRVSAHMRNEQSYYESPFTTRLVTAPSFLACLDCLHRCSTAVTYLPFPLLYEPHSVTETTKAY